MKKIISKICATALLVGIGTAYQPVVVEAEPLADGVEIRIDGFQISTTAEGIRTLYTVRTDDSCFDDFHFAEGEIGLIYAIEGTVDEEDFVYDYVPEDDTKENPVYVVQSTNKGELIQDRENVAKTFCMTLESLHNPKYYQAKIMIRAFAMDSESHYSDICKVSIYDLANDLYQKSKMPTKEQHDYLYDEILSRCNPSYEEVAFAPEIIEPVKHSTISDLVGYNVDGGPSGMSTYAYFTPVEDAIGYEYYIAKTKDELDVDSDEYKNLEFNIYKKVMVSENSDGRVKAKYTSVDFEGYHNHYIKVRPIFEDGPGEFSNIVYIKEDIIDI